MSELNVDIQTPGGITLQGTLIPEDYTSEQIIAELVTELNLPRISDDNEPVRYSLELAKQGQSLRHGQTLRNAGVQNGDVIILVSSHAVEIEEDLGIFESAGPSSDGNGDIEVVLSVLDLNRSERVSLPANRRVEDIIPQIASNYHLPSRDNLDELITYRIESKFLRRFLQNTETLQEAGIPRLDRLTLHRKEVAGA